ncbi:hypothetical protein QP986_06435 [Corynebacterium striatum]|nr:hypothetical protein [Corynebacterium striatum]MDK8843706.1 hypothetical protein [Corynebacterium striatum]
MSKDTSNSGDLTGFYPNGKHTGYAVFYRGNSESAAEIPAC